MEKRLLDLFAAIEGNDLHALKAILINNQYSKNKISTKKIAGLLVLAAENSNFEAASEIISFNYQAKEKIPAKYICAALQLANKKGALKDIKLREMQH